MSTVISQPLRSDAQRNRAALLKAAAEAFAERGIEVSVGEIARRAGVAKGTLFRHFPAKRDLLSAVLVDRMLALRALVTEVSQSRSPGLAAVAELMTRGAEMLAADRSFFDAAMRDAEDDERLVSAKLDLMAALDGLLVGAQSRDEVRADINGVDIAMLMMAATNTCAPAQAREPQLWRRYIALMTDALRPGAITELPAPALSAAQLAEMRTSAGSAARGQRGREHPATGGRSPGGANVS